MKRALIIDGVGVSKNSSAVTGVLAASKLGYSEIKIITPSGISVPLISNENIGIVKQHADLIYSKSEWVQVNSTLKKAAESFTPEDQVFIYITAHGASRNFSFGGQQLHAMDFRHILSEMKYDQLAILTGQCEGGPFLDFCIKGLERITAVASLGSQEQFRGSKFNPTFLAQSIEGATIYESFLSARDYVRTLNENSKIGMDSNYKGRNPFHYRTQNAPLDLKL